MLDVCRVTENPFCEVWEGVRGVCGECVCMCMCMCMGGVWYVYMPLVMIMLCVRLGSTN